MLIALHGLALRKASDAISPLNAVVETGVLSHTTALLSAVISAAPLARAREDWREQVNARP